jgi:hypothetical protein
MKTLALFHRLELTDMFAPLSKALAGKMNIVHVAYGDAEREMLRTYQVAGTVVTFKDEVRRLWDGEVDTGETALRAIDDDIIEQTDGAFNLNGAIQSDRGFTLLSYSECLRLTVVYYKFWGEFLSEHKIDYVMHEPTSQMMNFIGAVLCHKRGAQYVYHIMCAGDRGELNYLTMSGFDFSCPDLERQHRRYLTGEKAVDRERCGAYLEKFRKNFSVYLGGAISSKKSWTRLAAVSLRNRMRRLVFSGRYDRCTENIDYWSMLRDAGGQKLRNLIRYSREIEFSKFDPDVPYYYYPMHLEPEAVVLYHGHGLYRNQVKLVENIAAQLPPGALLYVKDHPHDFGYRSADDYKALQKVPNIRLIRHDVPGKRLIHHAIGVITITGTAGFEALLMGKQIYTFGKAFYSVCPRVQYIRNVRDLREALYRNRDVVYTDDADLYNFLSAYLETLNEGMTDYFAGRAAKYNIDLDRNIRRIAENFLRTVEGA